MAQKKEKRAEDPPPGPGEWIVTFTDCMTLLLCFFVLLLAFSTFKEASLQKLDGAFGSDRRETIFPALEPKSEMVDPMTEPSQNTQDGSRVMDDVNPPQDSPPRSPELPLGDEAYKDRKIVRVPSDMLFGGRSSELTAAGKKRLDLIAGFLEIKPCRVVIGESRPASATGPGYVPNIGMRRSWAVVEYLTSRGDVDSRSFSISADGGAYSPRIDEPTIEIVMLSEGVNW